VASGAITPYYAISDFTFDSTTGVWTGIAQNNATPSLRFYKQSDGSLITVDITDPQNYFPGGDLFGITPPGSAGTGIQIEITVDIAITFAAGHSLAMTITTDPLDAISENTSTTAEFAYTGDSGTISGDFGTISMTDIILTASEQGAVVTGSYAFTTTIDDQIYQGTVAFTEEGCSSITLTDEDGTPLGTTELDSDGNLIFTNAETGESTELDRIE
jgi:hypothetical protein